MVRAPVWSIIHLLKYVGYLSVKAQKPCCMSDLQNNTESKLGNYTCDHIARRRKTNGHKNKLH